jgi:hypothetical protein
VEPPLELKEEGHFAACHRNPQVDARTVVHEGITLEAPVAVEMPGAPA